MHSIAIFKPLNILTRSSLIVLCPVPSRNTALSCSLLSRPLFYPLSALYYTVLYSTILSCLSPPLLPSSILRPSYSKPALFYLSPIRSYLHLSPPLLPSFSHPRHRKEQGSHYTTCNAPRPVLRQRLEGL